MSPASPNPPRSSPNVVFLAPGFPADEADTTCIPALQNYVHAFARAHRERSVAVIAFQYPAPRRRYRWHGIEVHAAGGGNRRGVWRRLTWRRAAAAFARLRRDGAVDVLHSFWLGECSLVAQRLVQRFGGRHVASIMGQDATAAQAYLRRLDLARMTITCGSAFAARQFQRTAGRAVDRVVPLGLDIESFGSIDRARDIDILGIGSLTELKNYALFVELVADLRAEHPGVKAVLIGDGPERGHLQRMIAERGLEGTLSLAGELPRPQVIDHLLRSRICLHPARFEGQGYVFLEALHAGLSVVSFDVGHRPPSARAHACASADEMRARLHDLLHERPPPLRVPVDTVDDTVAAFSALYAR